jgi:hypothetical protein
MRGREANSEKCHEVILRQVSVNGQKDALSCNSVNFITREKNSKSLAKSCHLLSDQNRKKN